MPTEPTISELFAQQAEISRQIAQRSIFEVQAAIVALNSAEGAIAEIAAIQARLPDGSARQILSRVTNAHQQAQADIGHALSDLQLAAEA